MNWTFALPELVLALSGLAILGIGVLPRANTAAACAMATIGAFLLTAVLVTGAPEGTAFNGQFVNDAFARFAKLLILLGGAASVSVSLDFNRRERLDRFEYPVLLLFATLGMMVMVSAHDLMTLYIGLELMSLSSYVIAAFNRDNERSAEAGLKYFVLGALASGLLLYGISLIYGFAGTTNFDRIADAVAEPATVSAGLVVGLIFVITGLAFKVSAVPFHMWTPDVYEGAPTPVTAFFAAAPKVAGMALFARVLGGPFWDLAVQWQQVVVVISLLSMVLGAFAAISQANIKRLMAYSAIGHAGYALVGLASASEAGFRGLLLYVAIYMMMSLGAFSVLVAMRRQGRAVERVDDLAGLAKTDLGMAVWMAVFMFSMAGIPPLAGFFAKVFVLKAAIDAGLWTLALVGVLASVVSAFYYLRIIKVMFFDESRGALDARPAGVTFVVVVAGLFNTLFFLFPAPLVAAAQAAVAALLG